MYLLKKQLYIESKAFVCSIIRHEKQSKTLFYGNYTTKGDLFILYLTQKKMETQEENITHTDLSVTTSSKDFLLYASKWSNFLAILGFVGIGLMVLGGLIVTIIGTSFPGIQSPAVPMGLIGKIYLLLGLLYFFPTLYLYNFAQNIKKALVNSSQQNLDLGFENLKSFFKFIGIFSIVTISLYILLFLFAAVSAIIFAG